LETKPFFPAQNSIIIKNALDVLSKISDSVKTSGDLQNILTTLPFSDKKGNFRIIYSVKPLFNKIDINTLIKNGKTDREVEKYILNILNYYQIQDPLFFEDLLLDTIDSDAKEREGYSEIVLSDPYFQNGKIYNIKHLKQIEKYYYKKTDDKNIFKIPWEKFIFFGDGNPHILECNLISKQTAEFLGFAADENISCKNILSQENNKTVQNLNIIAYDKNKSFWIENDITYFLNEKKENIKIIYDIHNKKVISVESSPVY
jgi:hypothetical protein